MSEIEIVKASIKSTTLSDEEAEKLSSIIDSIPEILKELDDPDYDEIYGCRINETGKEYVDECIRNEILLKFLIADGYDIDLCKERLIDTLKWRSKFQPLSAAFEEAFDPELNALGVITNFQSVEQDNLYTATWNLYGNLKDPKKIFKKFGNNKNKELPGSQFLRWRVGLMERSLSLIDLCDPKHNKIAQVHDYNNVSMFKIDPDMKVATKQIIEIFGANYPELLSTKFFVNVPHIMGWVFTFFKTIRVIQAATLKKFQVLSHGDLSSWFGTNNLPKEYGGQLGKDLFALDTVNIDSSQYAKVILKRIGDAEIAQNDLEVE
ncbi:Phosphatidylinositol transfer protein SFH5 [Spathaspora sp. JA1]|nr:Phosphatidylinositol transfer protein SFH5 [Spathaspora sp. JA1]